MNETIVILQRGAMRKILQTTACGQMVGEHLCYPGLLTKGNIQEQTAALETEGWEVIARTERLRPDKQA